MWEDLSVVRLQKHDLTRSCGDANLVMGFNFAHRIECLLNPLGLSHMSIKRVRKEEANLEGGWVNHLFITLK